MAARDPHYALAGQACEVLAVPMELENQAPWRWSKPVNWAGFWLWTWVSQGTFPRPPPHPSP
eukprot:6160609-Amphidinium_carterae.1